MVTDEVSESFESKESNEHVSDERELEREWCEAEEAKCLDFCGIVEGNWLRTGVVQVGSRSSSAIAANSFSSSSSSSILSCWARLGITGCALGRANDETRRCAGESVARVP